jgi:hypothetical protein
MMLKHYRKEFRRPPNPSAKHLRCVAYLDENISMVFALLVTEGKKCPEHCPQLDVRNKMTLQEYLKQF